MTPLSTRIQGVLREYLSDIMARSILSLSLTKSKVDLKNRKPKDGERLLFELSSGVKTYVIDPEQQRECIRKLAEALGTSAERPAAAPSSPADSLPESEPESGHTFRIAVLREADIVEARGVGREVARDLGFSPSMQIKLATAISELARNIVQYAGTGTIRIRQIKAGRVGLEVVAKDDGPGIRNVDLVMSDSYRSKTGMGVGLKGTKKMMDEFSLESEVGRGTRILLRKYVA